MALQKNPLSLNFLASSSSVHFLPLAKLGLSDIYPPLAQFI